MGHIIEQLRYHNFFFHKGYLVNSQNIAHDNTKNDVNNFINVIMKKETT